MIVSAFGVSQAHEHPSGSVAIPHSADVVADVLRVDDRGSENLGFCIGGSIGRRVTSESGDQRPPTVGVPEQPPISFIVGVGVRPVPRTVLSQFGPRS